MTDETTDEPSQYSEHDSGEDLTDAVIGAPFEASFEAPFEAPVDDARADAGADAGAQAGEPDAESRAQAARRIAWAPRTRVAVASLALVAMMFLFVFPTRSYLAQKRQVGRAAHAVEVLQAQNAVLERQAKRLTTRSEIERLAREQFNMVLPGEQAYNVVVTPSSSGDTTTTTVP
jgi:cell division protein FtsB